MSKKTKKEIKDMHEELSKLLRMTFCENCYSEQSLERNHSLIYAGQRMDEPYALRCLCSECHRGNNGTIHRKADLINKVNAISEGLHHLQIHYPKRNWAQELSGYLYELQQLIRKEIYAN